MTTLLLICIYIAFIGLGLPDGLLGAAWPIMQADIAAPLSAAGIVSVIITVGTIVSSLLSDRLTRRFGAGVVTAVSVATTAAALFGFSQVTAFWQLCAWSIPYGLGAGAVDAALNNVVALHCKARHMSWLHAFWGVGASIGPHIMSAFLTGAHSWHGGYVAVGIVQIAITAALFCSLPLFGRLKAPTPDSNDAPAVPLGTRAALKIPGVKAVVVAFFAYCAAEGALMLWSTSYLNGYHHLSAESAASLGGLFYLGMMLGRFAGGFLAEKFSDALLIRVGIIVSLGGTVIIALPLPSPLIAAGLFIIGIGCAPIYPSIIHSTPLRFGAERSGAIIGIEMAGAYTGCCVAPPIFGLIGEHISLGLFPLFIAVFFVLLAVMIHRVNKLHPLP